MMKNRKPPRLYQAGFSLVEIMVGLVIGLLATLVIMQVFSVFEGQKRTTTGVADAQINGSIALFSLGRELQIAGYALLPLGEPVQADSPLECTTLSIDGQTGYDPASGIAAIAPVIIIDGGSVVGTNNTDSITIHYGATNMGGVPNPISLMGPGASEVSILTDLGCQVGDDALIYNGAACALAAVSGVQAASGTQAAEIALNSIPAEAAVGANFSCLGTWGEVTYRINNGNLERNGTPVISDIVNIQAQYGISASAGLNTVGQWVDATSTDGWDDPTVADRNRIKAVRIAIVARNGTLEKEDMTEACSSIYTDAPTGLCAWSATSLSPTVASPAPWIRLSDDDDGTSWKRYRYRVFETVIPLRNMIWSKSTL